MAKKPRFIPQPGSLVEVSNRAVGARFLLKPSKGANELIAGVLARAARRNRMQIVFYVFLSSHCHLYLIVQSARQLAEFMEYLDSQVEEEARKRFYLFASSQTRLQHTSTCSPHHIRPGEPRILSCLSSDVEGSVETTAL